MPVPIPNATPGGTGMKFTEKGLFNLKPRTERYEVWETNDHGKVCR